MSATDLAIRTRCNTAPNTETFPAYGPIDAEVGRRVDRASLRSTRYSHQVLPCRAHGVSNAGVRYY